LEANNIGWSWWTLKKLESTSGLYSILKPVEYAKLLSYWSGQSAQPTVAYAVDALNKLNQNILSESCIKNAGIMDALFRQPGNTATIPFAINVIPGIIFAADYDQGQNFYAYKDADYQNIGNTTYNSGGKYRNDGVDIEGCNDFPTNGYDVGWINAGEFLTFTTTIEQAGIYKIDFRLASNSATGMAIIRCDGISTGKVLSVPNTGGWQNWQAVSLDSITLPQGEHKITISFLAAGFNLNYLEFILIQPLGINETEPLNAFSLRQNFPNPFNPATTITFELPEKTNITLTVYNQLGVKVAVLANGEKGSGFHSVEWNAGNMASGVYFYELKADKFRAVKKLLLLK